MPPVLSQQTEPDDFFFFYILFYQCEPATYPEIVHCGQSWYHSCITGELQCAAAAAVSRVQLGARLFRDLRLAERSVPSVHLECNS